MLVSIDHPFQSSDRDGYGWRQILNAKTTIVKRYVTLVEFCVCIFTILGFFSGLIAFIATDNWLYILVFTVAGWLVIAPIVYQTLNYCQERHWSMMHERYPRGMFRTELLSKVQNLEDVPLESVPEDSYLRVMLGFYSEDEKVISCDRVSVKNRVRSDKADYISYDSGGRILRAYRY
jgi:hypothetical protein